MIFLSPAATIRARFCLIIADGYFVCSPRLFRYQWRAICLPRFSTDWPLLLPPPPLLPPVPSPSILPRFDSPGFIAATKLWLQINGRKIRIVCQSEISINDLSTHRGGENRIYRWSLDTRKTKSVRYCVLFLGLEETIIFWGKKKIVNIHCQRNYSKSNH